MSFPLFVTFSRQLPPPPLPRPVLFLLRFFSFQGDAEARKNVHDTHIKYGGAYIFPRDYPTEGAGKWDDVFAQIHRSLTHVAQLTLPSLRQTYEESRDAFEILGCDFLVDESLHVWLMEINSTPGYNVVDNTQARVDHISTFLYEGIKEFALCKPGDAPLTRVVPCVIMAQNHSSGSGKRSDDEDDQKGGEKAADDGYRGRRGESQRHRRHRRERSRSPRRGRSRSPRRRSRSPRRSSRSLSPRRRSVSPRRRSMSPRRQSVSPRRHQKEQRHLSPSS